MCAVFNPPYIPGYAWCSVGAIPTTPTVRPEDLDWAMDALESNAPGQWIGTPAFDQNMFRLCRILVDSGTRTASILVAMEMIGFHRRQRAIVGGRGWCTGGCHLGHLMEHRGESLCRRTMRPCPWLDDRTLAIAKLFDWQNLIDLERKQICRPTHNTI